MMELLSLAEHDNLYRTIKTYEYKSPRSKSTPMPYRCSVDLNETKSFNNLNSGLPIGHIVMQPISGLLAETSYGWPSSFYMIGKIIILLMPLHVSGFCYSNDCPKIIHQ